MYIRNKYINVSVKNPFETWWKARKYFKFHLPCIKIGFGKHSTSYARIDYEGKIFDANIHDVYWKDKYNSPRHERDPLVFISVFRFFYMWIIPGIYYYDEFGNKVQGNPYYWEYLLDYLYYNKTLKLTDIWTHDSKVATKVTWNEEGDIATRIPYKEYVRTQLFSLNKRGLKEFKKLYENKEK